jgi:predicted ATPase
MATPISGDLEVYPLVSFAAQAMPWQVHYLSSCATGKRVDFGLLETALPGSIILIEHPEFCLHGSLVTAAARQMAQAAARGVQIIVETHCDHILNGIRLAIHQGELAPDRFNCLHFAQQPGLPVEIQEILFDRRGRSRTWPKHFFDEWENALEKLLDPIDP